MKKTLRGLGIGLFLAGALYTVIGYLQTPEAPATPETTKQYQEKIHVLEQQLKQANEEIALLEKSTAENKKETVADKTDETVAKKEAATTPKSEPVEKLAETTAETKKPTENKAQQGTIYIYEGVSLYDIGKQAEDAGIIESSRELELFLAKPEYAKSIQKGQFELNSSMSLQEMALILTGTKSSH